MINNPLSIVLISLPLMAAMLFDWWTRRIPHFITVTTALAALLFSAYFPAHHPRNALIGGGIAFALFALIHQIANRYGPMLGFGDVMLAMMIGTMGGVMVGLWALIAGMLTAGGAAAYLWWKRPEGDRSMPYGLFLALGALIYYGYL